MNQLQQGIAAARAGRKAEARALLMQVVEADERSEQGWLWLSGVVEEPDDMRTCLQNVLDINPSNAAAKKGLAWIEARHGPARAEPARQAPAPAEPAPLEKAVGEPEPPARSSAGDPEAFTRTTAQLRPVPPRAEPAPPAEVFDPLAPAPAKQPAPAAAPPNQRFDPLAQPLTTIPAPAPAAKPSAPPANRTPMPPTQRMSMPAAPAPSVAAPGPRQPEPAAPAAAKKRPEPPITTLYAPVVPLGPAESPELLCPYCGSPTTLKQQRCTQCRQSLMVRAAPAAGRSPALTALSIVWGLGGAIVLATAGLLALLLLLLRQAPAGSAPLSSNALAIGIAVLVVYGGIALYLARGLWARVREFYYLGLVLSLVGLVLGAGLALRGAGFLGGLAQTATSSASWSAPLTQALAALPLVLAALLVALPLVLAALSYRDFFGPLTRFTPTIEKTDHLQHYNKGIGYRDRGMLFMAIQEWAAANRLKPTERTYLQTLGLAYAQIKKLYPNSTASLGNIETFLRARKAELYATAPELERLNLL